MHDSMAKHPHSRMIKTLFGFIILGFLIGFVWLKYGLFFNKTKLINCFIVKIILIVILGFVMLFLGYC